MEIHSATNTLPVIYDLTFDELADWLAERGEPHFRAGQIFHWLYVKKIWSFAEMSNLSAALRSQLQENFRIHALQENTRQESRDGTIKFLFDLVDGNSIETVIMRHDYGNSVCVTTQVGCRMGCTFCASTLGGLRRNLTPGEIVAQVVEADRWLAGQGERVKSVVVMGIGEPFDNYEALITFLRILIHPQGMHIGQRHITVSTSGIVPRMYDFASEGLQVTLAVSLHAPNSDLRSRLMPVNRRYSFDELLAACHAYVAGTGRRITFEYALMGGVNDRREHAEELGQLLQGLKCHVNLIPVNNVPERDFVRTERAHIFAFQRILEKYGIPTTIRREHGSDIAAACGQLRAQVLQKAKG